MIHVFDLDDTLLMSDSYNEYNDIKIDLRLNELLSDLNNKYIFTNGTYGHAFKSISYMNLPKFNGILARDNLYMNQPLKPVIDLFYYVHNYIYNHNYSTLCQSIIFYDDMLENLESAKKLGWITVWITKSNNYPPPYVDYSSDNIIDAITYLK